MKYLLSLILMIGTKILTRIFYQIKIERINKGPEDPWKDVRIYVFLNHTSLYEMLFLGSVPWRFIFNKYNKLIIPTAKVTLDRPLVGRFLKFLFPGMVAITRKRDSSWTYFLSRINEDSLVAIAPEGRMKRPTGLDKKGRPMSVMGGVSDILHFLREGRMMVAYSGGLHHVQVPGETIPRLFKTIRVNYESIEIKKFKEICQARGEESFKRAVQKELEARMSKYCPQEDPKLQGK